MVKEEGQTKPAATEKVDWNKFKQDKKDLRLKRKMAKTGFDKISEAKQIYEKLKWYCLLYSKSQMICVV